MSAPVANGHGRPWSEDELFVLRRLFGTVPKGELAAAMGRTPAAVQRQANLLGLVSGRYRNVPQAARRRAAWTTDDDDLIRERWGIWTPKRIAAALGRSVEAVRVRKTRLGLSARDNVETSRSIGLLFGVDSHLVARWIEAKLLRARRAGVAYGKHRVWNIDTDSLETFIREHPEEYDWRRMEEGYWRSLAREVWEADPLLTVREVAVLHGVSRWCVLQAIGAGRLRAARPLVSGANRPWRIRRSDARTFAPVRPELVGHRGRGKGKAA